MSYNSGGVSLKPPGGGGSMSYAANEEDPEQCCFGRCRKTKTCPQAVPFYHLKTRNDNIFCCGIFVMLASVLVGIILPLVINALVDSEINTAVVIDSTSAPSYGKWVSNMPGTVGESTTIDFQLFFFDIQNPAGILAGEKPVVVEVGPYAYDEYFKKIDISWSDDGDTVTYNIYKYFVFNQEKTAYGLTEFDNITIPYTTAIGFQYLLGTIPLNYTVAVEMLVEGGVINGFDKLLLAMTQAETQIRNDPDLSKAQKVAALAELNKIEGEVEVVKEEILAFVKVSDPSQLLFKILLAETPSGISPFWATNPSAGYFGWLNDPLLLQVQKIIDNLPPINGTVPQVAWSSAVVGSMINYTSEREVRRRRGPDTMKTGKKNLKEVSQYVRYQNMSLIWGCVNAMASQNTSLYKEGSEFPSCTLFQNDWTADDAEKAGYSLPFANPYANRIRGTNGEMYGRPIDTDKLQIFEGDIYRTAFFVNTGWHNDLYGLKLKRYQLQHKDLLNATANPENAQYYNFAPSGMLNLTSAANAPSWVSMPHFFGGDPILADSIQGLHPDPDLHQTYLDIEPQTGQLARARKALQTNWRMESISLPTIDSSVVTQVDTLCSQLDTLVSTLYNQNLTNITGLNCSLTLTNKMLVDLAFPSDWKLQNDVIYMPFVWCAETNVISADDAADITDGVYGTQYFAAQLQRWCFVIAGGSLVVLIVMFITLYAPSTQSQLELYKEEHRHAMAASGVDASVHDPLHPLMWTSPLKDAAMAETATDRDIQ